MRLHTLLSLVIGAIYIPDQEAPWISQLAVIRITLRTRLPRPPGCNGSDAADLVELKHLSLYWSIYS